MRQVGDRLIPVGVTSGRVHALTPEEAAAVGAEGGGGGNGNGNNGGGNGSRRRRRGQGGGGPFEQFMGMAGQDLEEVRIVHCCFGSCYFGCGWLETDCFLWYIAHAHGSDALVFIGS